MSKRLQVLMDEADLGLIRRMAEREGLSVAAWVRQQLKKAVRAYPTGDVNRKLGVVREATRNTFPAPDIDEMNAEIARGYGTGMPE